VLLFAIDLFLVDSFLLPIPCLLLSATFNGYEINQDNYKGFGWTLAIIIPLYPFTMYCLFYTIWFIAKCIATIENSRAVGFDNYAGNFFLLWFFPIGIWFVHPKVRKIFAMDTGIDDVFPNYWKAMMAW